MERPILMSGPMVRAILEGRKTQTRRLCRYVDGMARDYAARGDLLWVREAHALVDGPCWSGLPRTAGPDGRWCYYREGFDRTAPRWRPSIHMPRWASRLTLRVEAVRVERLQEISEADARAEGVAPVMMDHGSWLPGFEGLWDSINGARAPWASDPWVWVVGFSRLEVS